MVEMCTRKLKTTSKTQTEEKEREKERSRESVKNTTKRQQIDGHKENKTFAA